MGLRAITVAEWLEDTWVIGIYLNVTEYYCVFYFHLRD